MRFHRVVVLKGQKRRLEKKRECWFSLLPQNMWSKGQKLGDLVEALDCRLVQQKRMSRKLTAPLLCNATQTSAHQRILGLPRTSWKHSTSLEFAWPRSQWDGQTFLTVTNSNGTLWHVVLRYFYHLLPLLPFFPRIPAMCCVSAGEAGGRRALQGLNIPWQWYCWCRNPTRHSMSKPAKGSWECQVVQEFLAIMSMISRWWFQLWYC